MKTSPRYINYNIDLMSSFSFIVYFTFQIRQPFISDPGFVKFTQQGKLKIMDVLLLPYNFIQKFHCYISLYLVGLRSIVHYCLDFIINILLRSIVHYCLVFIKKILYTLLIRTSPRGALPPPCCLSIHKSPPSYLRAL